VSYTAFSSCLKLGGNIPEGRNSDDPDGPVSGGARARASPRTSDAASSLLHLFYNTASNVPTDDLDAMLVFFHGHCVSFNLSSIFVVIKFSIMGSPIPLVCELCLSFLVCGSSYLSLN